MNNRKSLEEVKTDFVHVIQHSHPPAQIEHLEEIHGFGGFCEKRAMLRRRS